MDQKTAGELLFHLLSAEDGGIIADRIENLSVADWHEYIKLSMEKGAAPLLYHILKTTGVIDHIPDEIVQEFRRVYLFNAQKNMRSFHWLSEILERMGKEDIPVIILKGAALAGLIYLNIALRPMSDIDMIVKVKDIWRADSILNKFGYGSNVSSLLSKRHVKWTRHLMYYNRNLNVEIHPRISELPELDPWVNAVPAEIASNDVFVLSPEDLLLHQCCHLDNHLRVDGITNLIWYYDIAAILRHHKERINWDYVVQIAGENEVENRVHRVLRFTNDWSGIGAPEDILSQLADDGSAISVGEIMSAEPVQHKVDSLKANVAAISKIPSFHNRIYHIFRSVFPCREYMRHQYSVSKPGRVYFYYFVRTGKGAVKAVKFLHQLPGYLKSKRA